MSILLVGPNYVMMTNHLRSAADFYRNLGFPSCWLTWVRSYVKLELLIKKKAAAKFSSLPCRIIDHSEDVPCQSIYPSLHWKAIWTPFESYCSQSQAAPVVADMFKDREPERKQVDSFNNFSFSTFRAKNTMTCRGFGNNALECF